MRFNQDSYRIEDLGRLRVLPLILGVLALVISVTGWISNSEQFYYSYLTSFIFWLSVALGALFFILLHHLVNATWSVVVRRIAETMMMNIPVLLIFMIPILFGIHDLFHWSHHDAVAHDAILQKKESYLNTTFFIVRAIAYFLIWIALSYFLFRKSLKQDNGELDPANTGMVSISAPGMILFAATITFAAFDWMMSLDPHWYSTIYGVNFFAGSVMAMLAVLILISSWLRFKGILTDVITIEHFHDMGKLLFAFIILWAYMAFSQYFLIWYANIPEETVWYLHRWEGSWKNVSLLIVFGHFVLPFFALITRPAKRNPLYLSIIAIWILIMHWVDLFWNITPNLHHHAHISWMDFTTMAGIGGVCCWFFWNRLKVHPIVAHNDPKLSTSIKMINPF